MQVMVPSTSLFGVFEAEGEWPPSTAHRAFPRRNRTSAEVAHCRGNQGPLDRRGPSVV